MDKKILTGYSLLLTTIYLCCGQATAAINMDRTRIVFDGGNQSISLAITNDDNKLPYLAQAWVEDINGKKVNTLVVIPPVQRVEAGARSLVRIAATQATKTLPQDRESLFYFNLRGIPPKTDKPNILQLALQTKVKLFYRPSSIKAAPDAVWQNQVILHRVNNIYAVENPTPYYLTLIAIKEEHGKDANIEPLIIAPKSSADVKSPSFKNPVLTFINDYGGRPEITFTCHGELCRAK